MVSDTGTRYTAYGRRKKMAQTLLVSGSRLFRWSAVNRWPCTVSLN
jgi:hypothetical protein